MDTGVPFPLNTKADGATHVLRTTTMEFHGVTTSGAMEEIGHGETATCIPVHGDIAMLPWNTFVPTAQVLN